ncbi:hypothetical protein LMG1861_02640 [Achromobacter piechaudii]|uniref:NAD(P)-binding domain-containing protein n=2 Tax=Achromobacter piechaudii TaxID=72556 RepID=A0A6S7DYT2_9BURK|nr:hypothetical protein LMG1861_02640 [Achromobacter piechaudii]
MSTHPKTILVVGATGSIGRLVVAEALRQRYQVRALVRDLAKARGLPEKAQSIVGDLTLPETLSDAVEGVSGIVFTHGADGSGKQGSERVDYGGVRNVIAALAGRQVRIALMTAIGVTNRDSAYNRSTLAHDWKRRAERLVRASGMPYAIVRPGWFDYNRQDQHQLVALQGDTRHAGDPTDGVVARNQIAQVLVSSLASASALGKTFELVAEHGPATTDFDALFKPLRADPPGSLDGAFETDDMPLDKEPADVRGDLRQYGAIARGGQAGR